MERSKLPLNALRAFEAAARHLSFTRAAEELCVTQAALSHQIKALEARMGCNLFRRVPRGVALTDEGAALVPALTDAFDRVGALMDVLADGRIREVVTLGAVSTFATGFLLPRLHNFLVRHPEVDLRILTNNNKPEFVGEGLDCAIRFGDGAWHGMHATPIMDAPLSVMCAPSLGAILKTPSDLIKQRLLRSYRSDEWPAWFAAVGLEPPKLTGPILDSSLAIAHAVMGGVGIGLLPRPMFSRELSEERLVIPFEASITKGSYWLTRYHARPETQAMRALRTWLLEEVEACASAIPQVRSA